MQSMYDRTLEFIRRGHSYSAFGKALELTKGRGIMTGAHIIVGFPTETREEIDMTIRFACETELDEALFSIVIPYPGTELSHQIIENELTMQCIGIY